MILNEEDYEDSKKMPQESVEEKLYTYFWLQK